MPGGQFSKSVRPELPGVYTDFVATPQTVVLPSTEDIVLVPFTSDWGPFKAVEECASFQDYLTKYGTTKSDSYRAVYGAFQGEGIPGFPGAGIVLAYRFGTSAAAKATKTLQNSTPADAITVTALYEGTRANNFKVEVRTNALDVTLKDFVVYEGTAILETFTFTPDDLADLASTVNASSRYVQISVLLDGTALANTAIGGVAMTGGNNGDTSVTSGDWAAVLTAVQPFRFSVLAPANLTDGSVQTAVGAWADNVNTKGKRVMAVLGGAAGENIATANTRSKGLNSPYVINLGQGTLIDEDGTLLSTAQLAPRIAGILAHRGERQSLTFARLAGLDFAPNVNQPTEDDQLLGMANGTVTIGKDSHPLAPLRLVKGVTTFTTKSDANRPYRIYSNPKFIRTMGGFETELNEFGEQEVIGQLPINKHTRDFVIGRARQLLQKREDAGVIQPGWTVDIDQNPPPQSTDEFVALAYQWTFGRSTEQLFNTVVVS
jgi:hypothetical protein